MFTLKINIKKHFDPSSHLIPSITHIIVVVLLVSVIVGGKEVTKSV